MQWLVRLLRVVLDCFMGSGSTGVAAMLEGFRFIGVELDPEHAKVARLRIQHAAREADEASGAGGGERQPVAGEPGKKAA